jgi:ribonuclease HIII
MDFEPMDPIPDEEPEISERQLARADLDEEQTVFSARTDKVEIMGTDERGKGDKDIYHKDC